MERIAGEGTAGSCSGSAASLCACWLAAICCVRFTSGNSKTAFVGALVIWLFATIGLSIRPQVIGYNLLIVELLLVHLGSTRSPRWFYGLPPLFAVWVNCHGSFLLGLVLLGMFVFCSFFQFRVGLLTSPAWDPVRRRTFIVAGCLSAVATLLNPVGLKQVLYPVNTLLHQPIAVSQTSEWQPLQWSDPRGMAMIGLLGCIFLLLILRQKELWLSELLSLAGGTWLALNHGRMLFVFGILVAPVFSRLIASEWDRYEEGQDIPWANAAMLSLSLLVAILAFPSRASLTMQVDAGNPVKAVKFIPGESSARADVNAFNYGGYLIWALPEHPVFIDGRADVFEWSGVFLKVMQWANLESDPNELLDQYHVNFCLLERPFPDGYGVVVAAWLEARLLRRYFGDLRTNGGWNFLKEVPTAVSSSGSSYFAAMVFAG